MTVQPPAVNRPAAVSANPVLLVLFSTTIGMALSGSTVTVGDADDELAAGELDDADDDAPAGAVEETDPVGVAEEWSATGDVRIAA